MIAIAETMSITMPALTNVPIETLDAYAKAFGGVPIGNA